MLRSRLGRYLLLFFIVYLTCVVLFFRSFETSDNEIVTPQRPSMGSSIVDKDLLPIDPLIEQQMLPRPAKSLEPVMKKGILGNYESRDPTRAIGPGEYGEGVQLQGEEIERGQESVAEYGFNEVASDKISLDRHPRDTRYSVERPSVHASV